MSNQPPNRFTDFLSPTVSNEGPVSTRNIPRGKVRKEHRKRRHRKKRREERA